MKTSTTIIAAVLSTVVGVVTIFGCIYLRDKRKEEESKKQKEEKSKQPHLLYGLQ